MITRNEFAALSEVERRRLRASAWAKHLHAAPYPTGAVRYEDLNGPTAEQRTQRQAAKFKDKAA